MVPKKRWPDNPQIMDFADAVSWSGTILLNFYLADIAVNSRKQLASSLERKIQNLKVKPEDKVSPEIRLVRMKIFTTRPYTGHLECFQ